MVCITVTCGQGTTRRKCLSVVGAQGGQRTIFAGAIICVQYLAKTDTVILTNDSTEYSPMTRGLCTMLAGVTTRPSNQQ